ncbi:hypothetical protein [Botryobacter ruber]|uniref:hypothetical protein n=1 Tax=Botryobacter ruber TaxID=2171629 RepID=UPI000F654C6C|nr:hypothetical protein [Botryobacter ruber]
MKKVIYSIFSVSVLLFASCSEDRGTTTEVADANEDEVVNQSNIRGFGDEIGKDVGANTPSTVADYRERSEHITEQMATDLQLDEPAQQRVSAIIYDRERRLGELEGRYNFSETNRMGGRVMDENDMGTRMEDPMMQDKTSTTTDTRMMDDAGTMERDNTAMTAERKKIMADADKELKSVLTAEQYNKFVQNRTKYDELKYKNDATDTKIKSEGDEMKYKSDDYKVKVEGDETKIKTENEKMKMERK